MQQPILVRIQGLHALFRSGLGNPDQLTHEQAMNPTPPPLKHCSMRITQSCLGARCRDGYRNHRLVGKRDDTARTGRRGRRGIGAEPAPAGTRRLFDPASATLSKPVVMRDAMLAGQRCRAPQSSSRTKPPSLCRPAATPSPARWLHRHCSVRETANDDQHPKSPIRSCGTA